MADRIKPTDFKANQDTLLRTRPLPPGARSTRDEKTRERKKRFDAAHEKGMDALRRGDYEALDEAVKEERQIITEQRVVIRAFSPRKKNPKATRKQAFKTIPVALIRRKKAKKKR